MKNYTKFEIEDSQKNGYTTKYWVKGDKIEIDDYFAELYKNYTVPILCLSLGNNCYEITIVENRI